MPTSGYKFDKIKVLIVEDNLPMLSIVKSVMQSFGCVNIYGAPNGEQGYKVLKEINPDLLIVDWMMSPMNGIEFTKKVRTSDESPNRFVPIILMTGFSQKRRVLEARDSGVNEFLVKPFNARDLYKRIVQVIENPRQYVDADQFFGPDRRRKKKDSYEGGLKREGDKPQGHDSFFVDIDGEA